MGKTDEADKADETKNLQIVLSEQVETAIAADPELGAAMQDLFAIFHQVAEGLKTGKYESFEDGMEILTGKRPKEVAFFDPKDGSISFFYSEDD